MAWKSLKQKNKISLTEKAKKDKELGAGVGRGNKLVRTREVFRTWLLIPRTYLGVSEQVLRALGIVDSEAIELHSIKSQGEFATKFGVAEPTLSRWKQEMEKGGDFEDFRMEMQRLTKNVMGALYRKTISDADAARVKLWLQVVEGWNETIHQDVRYKPYELSEEEKKELDRLIEKNRA